MPAAGGRTLFCRDFDDGRDVLFDWTDKVIDPSGSVTLDTTERTTPPASMLARLTPNPGSCVYVKTKQVIAGVSHARISYDLRLGGNGTVESDGVSFMVVKLDTCQLIFAANGVQGSMHEQSDDGTVDLPHDFDGAFPALRVPAAEAVVARRRRAARSKYGRDCIARAR